MSGRPEEQKFVSRGNLLAFQLLINFKEIEKNVSFELYKTMITKI